MIPTKSWRHAIKRPKWKEPIREGGRRPDQLERIGLWQRWRVHHGQSRTQGLANGIPQRENAEGTQEPIRYLPATRIDAISVNLTNPVVIDDDRARRSALNLFSSGVML